GRAKGLPNRQLYRKYILMPGLPYVITSFALTLVSFWQTMTALEVVFNWPGIGLSYVASLPHFFGEGMYPGELLVSIAIVVIFAYLLGIIVFLLDIIYIIVDPRIRLGNQEQVKIKIKFRKTRKKVRYKNIPSINNKKKTGFSSNPFHSSVKKTSKKFKEFWREIIKYPSAIFGFSILLLFIIGSITALVAYPYREAGQDWYTSSITGKPRTPRLANPVWVNLFRTEDLPITITFNTSEDDCEKEVLRHPDKNDEIIITCEFDYPYGDIPQNIYIYYTAEYDVKTPFTEITWITPSDDEIRLNSVAITSGETYRFSENIPLRKLLILNKNWNDWFVQSGVNTTFPLWMLFVESESTEQVVQNGVYQIRIDTLLFEENNNLDAEIIIFGQAHGLAGTDFMRRDLMFPLLWGMPFVIFFGLFGSILTTVLALVVSALGVWYGGWVDALIQRITEANMILPILAISILIHVIYRVDMMIIIGGVILMNVFGAPTKTFRAAFLQVKESPYIEAAQIYGASNWQLITRYMIPRILPVIVPQLVMLIPGFIFLEATFGMFNIKSNYPTWGRIIYEALKNGAAYGSRYWVLEPLFLLLLTGFAFTMLGSALDKVLNPKLKK
ncbi:MAG: ABC transporter permease subunit, partial [Anaerolineaceae bacterium]|nr:ABC transporter permease subunit [Anaerolineaceae bacterium]